MNDQYLFKKLLLGPLNIFGLHETFSWSSPDFSGKNSRSGDVKALGGGFGSALSEKGRLCKKEKVEDPWVRR